MPVHVRKLGISEVSSYKSHSHYVVEPWGEPRHLNCSQSLSYAAYTDIPGEEIEIC